MPGRFDGQVAIITGGALGIGGATARRLASEGAKVLIADFNDEAAAANVERIESAGGTAYALHTDVSVPADIERMVSEAVGHWGRLDILVQNAFSVVGGESRIHGTAETVDEQDWDWGIDVLAKALYLGAKHAVPHMPSHTCAVLAAARSSTWHPFTPCCRKPRCWCTRLARLRSSA